MDRYAVLVFHGQKLTDQQRQAFSRTPNLGWVDTHRRRLYHQGRRTVALGRA